MKTRGWITLGTCLLMLAGCGVSDEDELRQWMAEQRSQTRPRVAPLPEPKQFTPQNYAQEKSIEPFSKEKLAVALKRDSSQSAVNVALITPELARRKEALEAFPLDAMVMVGSLLKEGKPVALVTVDKLLYQVRPGNYLGHNYGRVTKITETEITLREVVQDAAGEWVTRPATLQLQERSK